MHCKRIGLLMGARSDIERLLDESYNVLNQAEGLIQAFELTDADAVQHEADDAFGADDNAPVVQVVNRIITQGVRSRASDIHIEPGEHDRACPLPRRRRHVRGDPAAHQRWRRRWPVASRSCRT